MVAYLVVMPILTRGLLDFHRMFEQSHHCTTSRAISGAVHKEKSLISRRLAEHDVSWLQMVLDDHPT